MKKLELKGQDVEIFTSKLDNGLTVILVPFKDKKNYFLNYAVKYGAADLEFSTNDKNIKLPAGIAHFLEHKMFEQEDGLTPFEFFSKTGSECNASTGYFRTRYYVYGTTGLKENLEYLIKYINSPYFTDENVEKEKNIIIEEINMYKDIPDRVIENQLNNITYNTHPIRIDIGGSEESVRSITKEDLYTCYNAFYQPSNMILAIGGTFDVDEIMTIIKKSFAPFKKEKIKVVPKKIKEKEEVSCKYKEIEIPSISTTKLAFSIKTKIGKANADNFIFRDYIAMILNILFGPTSVFNEELYKSKLVTSFYCEASYLDDLLIIEFVSKTNNPDEVVKKVLKQFKEAKITKKEVERNKKVWISSVIFDTDIVYKMVNALLGNQIIFNKILTNVIDDIRKMNLEELNKIRPKINYNNHAILVAKPKDGKQQK